MLTDRGGGASPLSGYMTIAEWFEKGHADPLFPNKSSIDWFIRNNRRELIETDALIPRDGRAGSLVHLEKFPQAVLGILKRRALEKDTRQPIAA